jgi:glycosyltransferase involved in cell wall biosynthesis
MMRSWNVKGQIFAETLDPALDASVRPIAELERDLAADDLLVIHYTAYAHALDATLDLPQRKLLVYHNVTPAELLWEWEPIAATRCALGRAHLREYAGRVEATATATAFNAADLRAAGFDEVNVLPALYLFDRARLKSGAGGEEPDAASTVIFVGRMSPSKRQDVLIKAFALYQRHRDPDARLWLVGGPLGSAYTEHLERVTSATGAQKRGHRRSPPARAQRRLPRGLGIRVPVGARGLLSPAAGGLALRAAGDRSARGRRAGGARKCGDTHR